MVIDIDNGKIFGKNYNEVVQQDLKNLLILNNTFVDKLVHDFPVFWKKLYLSLPEVSLEGPEKITKARAHSSNRLQKFFNISLEPENVEFEELETDYFSENIKRVMDEHDNDPQRAKYVLST